MAEAVAAWTGPDRRIEREQARLHFAERITADWAGEFGAEKMLNARVHLQRNRLAVGQPQRRFKAFSQALAHVVEVGSGCAGRSRGPETVSAILPTTYEIKKDRAINATHPLKHGPLWMGHESCDIFLRIHDPGDISG